MSGFLVVWFEFYHSVQNRGWFNMIDAVSVTIDMAGVINEKNVVVCARL